MIALFALLFQAAAPPAAEDEAAKAALKKLSDRFADLKVLSCKVTQTRKTALLEKPVVSSGRLFYRREPARLVFRLESPRKTEIHMDKTTYQVYRPDEKRLERLEFGDDPGPSRLLLIFQPKTDEVAKVFTLRRGEAPEGEIEVILDPADEKVRKHVTRLSLRLDAGDSTLRRISYLDAEGDELRLDLTELAINPELPAATFDLKVPEGTRVLQHELKKGR